jgi:cyclin B
MLSSHVVWNRKRGKPGILKTKQPLHTALENISNAVQSRGLEQKKSLKDATNVPKPSRVPQKQLTEVASKEKVESKLVSAKEEKKEKVSVDTELAAAKETVQSFSKELLNVQDIDRNDTDNPQLVSEYVNDIYDYMRELESRYPIKYRYLDGSIINGRMRGILIDWLVQVHLRFHLLQETLYLTVAIIDRFLQVHSVARNKLQLVGVTAMWIASKYEEMYAPEVGDFVYITDNAYTKADIRKTECIMLKALDFSLGRPLPLHFLRRNSKAGEVDASQHTMAKYFMELTITDYEMASTPPSKVAAAALCLSMKVLEMKTWNDTLQHYSKYTEEDLQPIMERIALLVTKAGTGKLTAIKTKYQSSKFMRISQMPELSSQLILDLAAAVKK